MTKGSLVDGRANPFKKIGLMAWRSKKDQKAYCKQWYSDLKKDPVRFAKRQEKINHNIQIRKACREKRIYKLRPERTEYIDKCCVLAQKRTVRYLLKRIIKVTYK